MSPIEEGPNLDFNTPRFLHIAFYPGFTSVYLKPNFGAPGRWAPHSGAHSAQRVIKSEPQVTYQLSTLIYLISTHELER